MTNLKTSQTSENLNKEKYIDKIIKLLALAGSNNENEAQVAMLKAQELMVKHNIEMADIESIDKVDKEVVQGKSGECITSRWKINLASVVAKNFRCKLFLSCVYGKKGKIVTFLGLKDDVEICKVMYQFVMKVAEKGMDRAYLEISGNLTRTAKGAKGDYVIGFIDGLSAKFEEQKEKNGWGLIVQCDNAVIESYEGLNLKTSTSQATIQTGGYSKAREMGYTDGKNLSYGTTLTGK